MKPKKRLIFTLLYSDGNFMLSRNFRLQKVGDFAWLNNSYNFSSITEYLDEIVVLNVTPECGDTKKFYDDLKNIGKYFFAPIAAGGGVRDLEHARNLFKVGADKVVLNTSLFGGGELASLIAREFGQQAIIASIDVRKNLGGYDVYIEGGKKPVNLSVGEYINFLLSKNMVGELLINSIDRDGTGVGLDLSILDNLPSELQAPLIISGGVGNFKHIYEGLSDLRVDGVATANLFNFVGDGFKLARNQLLKSGIDLPIWSKF
jgi:cyclase